MKDKLKGLILGVTIGSLITGATAFAASGKMIEVFYSVNDIKINNVSKMPTGEDKPFVYNGKTYVPLGFISNALKQQVKWDGSSKVIYIGETGNVNALYLNKDIKHMNYQSGDSWNHYTYNDDNSNTSVSDNIGTEYSNYLTMRNNTNAFNDDADRMWQYLEFPLNGNVKSLSAKLGWTDQYRSSSAIVKVTISADDKVIYTKEMKPGDFPEDLKLNLENVLKIQIKTQSLDTRISEIGLFNPTFIK